jgi:hypothetical protein
MNTIIKFYKEADNSWYADLPEFEGSKSELEMVSGADHMLDIVSEGENETRLFLSLDKFEGSNEFKLLREDEFIGGGWYMMKEYLGIELNKEFWLCDITKYVFGHMPSNIYFVKV